MSPAAWVQALTGSRKSRTAIGHDPAGSWMGPKGILPEPTPAQVMHFIVLSRCVTKVIDANNRSRPRPRFPSSCRPVARCLASHDLDRSASIPVDFRPFQLVGYI